MYKSRIILRLKPLSSRRALAKVRLSLGLPRRRRGGQPGNTNRLIHGRYAGRFLARRAQVRSLLREARTVIAELNMARRATAIALRLFSVQRDLDILQRIERRRALTAPTEAPLGSLQTTRGNAP